MSNIRMQTLHFHEDGHLVETRRVAMITDLTPGERVSQLIIEAASLFFAELGPGDCFAFVPTIPHGADDFAEITTENGVITLMQASWVPALSILVGRGGKPVRPGLPVDKRPYMEVV